MSVCGVKTAGMSARSKLRCVKVDSTATWVPGTPAHSWQAVAASGTSIGHKGTQVAAETITLAAVELFTNEELRQTARAEFDEARGPDYEYKSLLGDRDPPLDYRK